MIDILGPIFALTVSKPLPAYIQPTLDRWGDLIPEVTIVARECEEDNAFYYPADKTVVMCTELFDRPELTRFILNHELGHAFMHQNGIPMLDREAAADELAVLQSDDDEIAAGAKWFLKLYTGRDRADTWEGHPSPLDRAGNALCLMEGREDFLHERVGNRTCRVFFRSVYANWSRWLEVLPAPEE